MNGFDMLKQHNQIIIDNNPFSSSCILKSSDGKVQGSKESPEALRCFAPYTGLKIDAEGRLIWASNCEVTMNMQSVTIGKPEKNWKIDIYFEMLSKWVSFNIEEVIPDNTLGWYYMKLTLISENTGVNVSKIPKLGGISAYIQ